MISQTGTGGRHDVIVVGAGPAGSMSARELASAGFRVMLIDAREFPRSKPCGEALSPGATPLLDAMGVSQALRASGARELRGFRLRAPDGRFVSAGFGPPTARAPDRALAVSRGRLDAVLLDAAVAAGAEFRAPLRVFDVNAGGTVDDRSRFGGAPGGTSDVRLSARDARGRKMELRASWVIGADGLRSVVARRAMGGVRLGHRNRLAIVGRYASRAMPLRDYGELRLSGRGCLGAAPIEDGRWTVTVVIARERAPEISADPLSFYRAEVESYDFPRPPDESGLAEELQVTGPFDLTPRAVTAPGIVLAGDATGYFDPFTGQGIYRALLTGREAARAVRAALAEPARERAARADYERFLAALLRPGRRVQKLVDLVVSRPVLANQAGRLLGRRPGLLSLLLDVTGDRVPPGVLLEPAALAAAWARPHAPVPTRQVGWPT